MTDTIYTSDCGTGKISETGFIRTLLLTKLHNSRGFKTSYDYGIVASEKVGLPLV
jgi:hypothetical protein